MEVTKLRWILSGGVLSVALAHLLWPSLTIDTVTAILIIVAILPWAAPLIRSVEVPGIGKIELRGEAYGLKNPNDFAARVQESVQQRVADTHHEMASKDDVSTAHTKQEERFYAGARAGVKAVAKMLEDLSVTVDVDGRRERREIGRELASKLVAVADLVRPPISGVQ